MREDGKERGRRLAREALTKLTPAQRAKLCQVRQEAEERADALILRTAKQGRRR
jgi:hypothetical protein